MTERASTRGGMSVAERMEEMRKQREQEAADRRARNGGGGASDRSQVQKALAKDKFAVASAKFGGGTAYGSPRGATAYGSPRGSPRCGTTAYGSPRGAAAFGAGGASSPSPNGIASRAACFNTPQEKPAGPMSAMEKAKRAQERKIESAGKTQTSAQVKAHGSGGKQAAAGLQARMAAFTPKEPEPEKGPSAVELARKAMEKEMHKEDVTVGISNARALHAGPIKRQGEGARSFMFSKRWGVLVPLELRLYADERCADAKGQVDLNGAVIVGQGTTIKLTLREHAAPGADNTQKDGSTNLVLQTSSPRETEVWVEMLKKACVKPKKMQNVGRFIEEAAAAKPVFNERESLAELRRQGASGGGAAKAALKTFSGKIKDDGGDDDDDDDGEDGDGGGGFDSVARPSLARDNFLAQHIERESKRALDEEAYVKAIDGRWVPREEAEHLLAEADAAVASSSANTGGGGDGDGGAGGERRRGSTITSQETVEALAASGEDWGAVTVVDSAHQLQMTDVVLGGGDGAAEQEEAAAVAAEAAAYPPPRVSLAKGKGASGSLLDAGFIVSRASAASAARTSTTSSGFVEASVIIAAESDDDDDNGDDGGGGAPTPPRLSSSAPPAPPPEVLRRASSYSDRRDAATKIAAASRGRAARAEVEAMRREKAAAEERRSSRRSKAFDPRARAEALKARARSSSGGHVRSPSADAGSGRLSSSGGMSGRASVSASYTSSGVMADAAPTASPPPTGSGGNGSDGESGSQPGRAAPSWVALRIRQPEILDRLTTLTRAGQDGLLAEPSKDRPKRQSGGTRPVKSKANQTWTAMLRQETLEQLQALGRDGQDALLSAPSKEKASRAGRRASMQGTPSLKAADKMVKEIVDDLVQTAEYHEQGATAVVAAQQQEEARHAAGEAAAGEAADGEAAAAAAAAEAAEAAAQKAAMTNPMADFDIDRSSGIIRSPSMVARGSARNSRNSSGSPLLAKSVSSVVRNSSGSPPLAKRVSSVVRNSGGSPPLLKSSSSVGAGGETLVPGLLAEAQANLKAAAADATRHEREEAAWRERAAEAASEEEMRHATEQAELAHQEAKRAHARAKAAAADVASAKKVRASGPGGRAAEASMASSPLSFDPFAPQTPSPPTRLSKAASVSASPAARPTPPASMERMSSLDKVRMQEEEQRRQQEEYVKGPDGKWISKADAADLPPMPEPTDVDGGRPRAATTPTPIVSPASGKKGHGLHMPRLHMPHFGSKAKKH